MDELITVRDHSRPCEHGSLWPHWLEAADAKWWQEPECLGGRELILRRVGNGLWEEVPGVESDDGT
jgi:hypothetical protein